MMSIKAQQYRASFVKIQFIFLVVCAFIIFIMGEKDSPTMVLLISIWHILTYGKLLFYELKNKYSFDPILIYYIAIIQFSGFNGINIYIDILNGVRFEYGTILIDKVLAEASFFLGLEHFLFLMGYWWMENKRKAVKNCLDDIAKYNIDFVKKAIKLYVLIWSLRGIDHFFSLASISSLLNIFTERGQLVVLSFLTFALIKNPKNFLANNLHWIIVIIEIVIVLSDGMKEHIIVNLIPFIVYQILGYSRGLFRLNIKLLSKVLILFVFVMYIVFPFVACFRNVADKKGVGWEEITISESVDEYMKYIYSEGEYGDSNKNLSSDYLMSRAGKLCATAAGISYYESNGASPQYLRLAVIALVPRFIWPEKPQIRLGAMLGLVVHGERYWSEYGDSLLEAKHSDTFGFIGTGIFALGIIPACFIPFIIGCITGSLWCMVCQRVGYSIIALWFLFCIILPFLKDLEGYYDCGITSSVTMLVYMGVLYWFVPVKK